tara:strand:+ start:3387 stop:3989 length:603 start_codon:yes stop_codon:yes gene_type:complete
MNITVTDSAVKFLAELLETQNLQDPVGEKTNIRILVERPGTPGAETMLSYAKESEKEALGPVKTLSFKGFDLYVDVHSEKYLEDCEINHDADQFGGQLTIKAPNSKVAKLDENSTLHEKVNYYLINDINPMLASHGGQVHLSEITEDNIAVLQFGGGCQGCSAIDLTLKEGIEKMLFEKVPEIKGITDITDHSFKQNAYY